LYDVQLQDQLMFFVLLDFEQDQDGLAQTMLVTTRMWKNLF